MNKRSDAEVIKELCESLIELNAEARDWEEAVKLAGNLLVENDCAESRFVDAMVETVKLRGAYIVISKGLAIPHARPEDGAKKVCISIVQLKKPVEFGHPKNDPVEIVIALSSIDSKSHINLMSDLAKVLSDKNNIEKLKKAAKKQEVLDIFNFNKSLKEVRGY
jgi:PTS system ascorbate-specific IIA component